MALARIQVIWELEPGARVHEKMGLPEPTGFDDPARLDAFLDAVRCGAPPPGPKFGCGRAALRTPPAFAGPVE